MNYRHKMAQHAGRASVNLHTQVITTYYFLGKKLVRSTRELPENRLMKPLYLFNRAVSPFLDRLV